MSTRAESESVREAYGWRRYALRLEEELSGLQAKYETEQLSGLRKHIECKKKKILMRRNPCDGDIVRQACKETVEEKDGASGGCTE